MILLPRAGRASFLDQGNLLFVGHAVNVPQMLPATFGSLSGEVRPGSRGAHCRVGLLHGLPSYKHEQRAHLSI